MNKKRIAVMAVVAVPGGPFFSFDLGRYLTLTSLKENREALVAFYDSHRFAMVSAFVAVYIVRTALSLPGTAGLGAKVALVERHLIGGD
jgi:uncharacterized membrane protein YdjX (TVP38/TMEM64 family)